MYFCSCISVLVLLLYYIFYSKNQPVKLDVKVCLEVVNIRISPCSVKNGSDSYRGS